MAFRFLIDGYNLLYAFPHLPPGSLQDKRQQLLTFLKERRPQGNNPVTVVFDSREGAGDQFHDKELTVVYTAGGTADEWISAQVRKAAHPRALVVVSNDQGIRALVRGTGARFLPATEFLKAAESSSTHQADPRRQPPNTAQEITEEFKEKWL
jgi:predicted RNA-binding protein with PIN domain